MFLANQNRGNILNESCNNYQLVYSVDLPSHVKSYYLRALKDKLPVY